MKRLYLLISSLLFGSLGFGQSSHYWTETYGTRSMLLNGVVIGTVEDLGAVYYNPARLSQFETPAFVIAGKVYELRGLKMENALGDGLDVSRTSFGGAPSLVSGTFNVKFLKKSQFAYAFLTRARTRNNFNFSFQDEGDYTSTFPGNENYSGEIRMTNTVADEWMGLSWSYPLTDQWSVGLTGFYSNLTREAGIRFQAQAHAIQSGETGIRIEQRAYSYTSHSILGKFGVSFQGDKLTAGMVVTTPKLQGFGNATTKYETFYSGIDQTGDGTNDDEYFLNNQSDLALLHKTPWSIGLGTGFRLGNRSLLHLSAEWYSAIPTYTLLESASFIGQSDAMEYKMTVINRLGSVLNYGIGLELFVNDNVSLFGSYATDFSAVQSAPDFISDLGLSMTDNNLRADKRHLGLGTDIKTSFANLTLGATYGFSRETIKREFTIDDGQNPVTEDIDIFYSRWRFIVGFEFHFIDKLKAKIEDKLK